MTKETGPRRFRECAGEGCRVMIVEKEMNPVGDELCKWCLKKLQKHEINIKQPEPPRDGVELSRDEFGRDLYETIKTIGGIMQLKKNVSDPHIRLQARPRDLAKWERDLDQLWVLLPNQLMALPEEQQQDVIARYPWIMETA